MIGCPAGSPCRLSTSIPKRPALPPARSTVAIRLDEVLDGQPLVRENGRHRPTTNRQAILAERVNGAAADFKAMTLLPGMIREIEARGSAATPEVLVTAADEAVIESHFARLGAATEPADDGSHSR